MATAFPSYQAARDHSEMIRQQGLLAAQAAYIAAGVGVSANFNTLVAAIIAAENNHYDRLDAAAGAFGVANSARVRGNGSASHAQTWLSNGNNAG